MNENTLKNVLIGAGALAVLVYMVSLTNPLGRPPTHQTKIIRGPDVPSMTDAFESRGYDCGGPTQDSTVSVWQCNKEFGWGTVQATIRARAEDQVLEYAGRADVGNRNPEMAISELQFTGSFWHQGAVPSDAATWIQAHIADSSAITSFGTIVYKLEGSGGVRTLTVDADPYRK